MNLSDLVSDYEMRERVEKSLRETITLLQASQDKDVHESIERLLNWSPEDTSILKGRYGYVEGDENAPFFSEAYLYSLLGKEDARTLLALMRPIWKLAGIPRLEQP